MKEQSTAVTSFTAIDDAEFAKRIQEFVQREVCAADQLCEDSSLGWPYHAKNRRTSVSLLPAVKELAEGKGLSAPAAGQKERR